MAATPVLAQAPLIHVVAQLHFSALPRWTSEERDALHREMIALGFPELIEASMNLVEWSVSADMEHEPQRSSKQIPRLVFKRAGEHALVELREDQLLLKTTDYVGHEAFLATWFEVLNVFSSAVPKFESLLLHRMSLRYVDLIVPKQDEALRELVTSALLPPALPDLEAEPLFGSTVKVVRTGEERHLRVAFEEVVAQNSRLTKVLPDDLVEHDVKCGLSIKGQAHWDSLPDGFYGILDIEHVHTTHSKPTLGSVDKAASFRQLYDEASPVFWSVVTEQAQTSWS